MRRDDGRKATDLRPVEIIRGYTRSAPGSVCIRCGETVVLCTACWENSVPPWRRGRGSGWVTAEYDMLPGATAQRRRRNRMNVDGRTREIERLIGRSLRAVVDLDLLGENSILMDCDVLQADGGTRTAAITGAYVALHDCVRMVLREKLLAASPIRRAVGAVSVGRVDGRLLLDLNYREDVAADVDMNVVMTDEKRFVEIQGTAENATFTRTDLDKLVGLAARGIGQLFGFQQKALRKRLRAMTAASIRR